MKTQLFYLRTILESIEKIEEYISQIDEEELHANQLYLDAITKRFEVIGESAGCIFEEVREINPEIPWGEIKGLRNFLVHQYFNVDVGSILKTIREDLPKLKPQIKELIRKLESQEKKKSKAGSLKGRISTKDMVRDEDTEF